MYHATHDFKPKPNSHTHTHLSLDQKNPIKLYESSCNPHC